MVNRALIHTNIKISMNTHAGGQTDGNTMQSNIRTPMYNYVHLAQYHIRRKIFRFQQENYQTKNRALTMYKLDNTATV